MSAGANQMSRGAVSCIGVDHREQQPRAACSEWRSGVRSLTLHFSARLASADHGLRYLGPTLRGVFGHVLKSTVCVTPHGVCGNCHVRSACPYARIFEGAAPAGRAVMRRYDAVPQPFVLLVAEPGRWEGRADELCWGIRMFGDATDLAPYLIEAFLRSGEEGVGRHRVRFSVERITSDSGEVVYREGADRIDVPASVPLPARELPVDRCTLRWQFVSPVHIRSGGGLAATPTGLDMVLAGRRRWHVISSLHGQAFAREEVHLDAGEFRTRAVGLHPWCIRRYSGRQGRKVLLSGVVGQIEIEGPWHLAGDWLRTVEWLHLGKYASFGFGRVQWEAVG